MKKLLSLLLTIAMLFSFQNISKADSSDNEIDNVDVVSEISDDGEDTTNLNNPSDEYIVSDKDSENEESKNKENITVDNKGTEKDDNDDISNENEIDEKTVKSKEEIFSQTFPGNFIEIRANTRKIYLSEYYYFTEDKFEVQKDELYDILLEIDEYCRKNGKVADFKSINSGAVYCDFEISEYEQGSYSNSRFRVNLVNNKITVLGNKYELGDANKLIEYICDIFMDRLSSFETECDDKDYYYTDLYWTYKSTDDDTIIITTYDTENEFKLREIIEFAVTMNESYFDTVFDEIADHGDTIYCKVEHWGGIGSKYILTLESNDGKRQYVYNHNGGSFGAETSKTLNFELRHVLDGNKHLLVYERGYKNDRIVLSGKTGSDGVEEISIGIDMKKAGVFHTIVTPEPLDGKLEKYEFYGTEAQLKSGNSMSYIFGFPAKEDYIKLQRENADKHAPEQDPEKYETLMKGTRSDGGTIDYNINFIMEIPMEFNGTALPDWYKTLGSDVKMVIMGITNVIDGKESNTDYTMIRFKGSKDELWFTRSQTEFDLHSEDEYLTADTTYNSLISFDGYKRIRNTVDYDSMSAAINYTNNDNMDLYSVNVKIGLKESEFLADEIKYIGGGRAKYEKLW